MGQKIDEIEFVVLDIETTGLNPDLGDRIIELACVKLKGKQRKEEFNSLINPKRPISEEALSIHHIDSSMLNNAPVMKEVMPKFLEFIQGSVICAYNAGFDMSFISTELKLLNQRLPANTHIIDILAMSRRLLPGLESYSLISVSENLGIKGKQQHRALLDVYMAIEVFKHLQDIFKSKGIDDFASLHSLFGLNSPYLEDMRNQKLNRIQEAIDLNVKLKIRYLSRHQVRLSEREVIPLRIKQENNRFYLVGFCNLRQEERTFSVDGILNLEIV